MKHIAIALLLALASANAHADEPAPTVLLPAPLIPTKSIRVSPKIDGLALALAKSGLHSVSTSITLTYDELGNVVSVKVDKPTGSARLDKAIIKWGSEIKIDTKEPGAGSLQVVMSID